MSESLPGPAARKPSGLKAVVVVIGACALVVTGLWYWRASQPRPAAWSAGPIDVVAITVQASHAPVSIDALGELRAVRQVTLAAEAAGRVTAIAFQPGQQVKAGAALVQLDDGPEQADLAAAKAAAAFAQQQWARANELAATGAQSREVLQQRQAERDQTAAQVLQLQARIRQKHIRAPFEGQLGLRQIDLGQYLMPGDSAVTLTDLDKLFVNFDVPQHELARIQVGQSAQVRVDTAGAEPLLATISAIEPQVGRATRNASIQAELDNPGHLLQPGMYASVAVALPAQANALVVPVSAVMTSASGDAAAVVRQLSTDQRGKAEIVPVVVGRRIGDQVVVTQGLQAGDVLVTEGQLRVRPGAELRVLEKPAVPAAAGGKH